MCRPKEKTAICTQGEASGGPDPARSLRLDSYLQKCEENCRCCGSLIRSTLFHISFSLTQVIPGLARPWADARFKEEKAPSQPSSCSRSNERSEKSRTEYVCGGGGQREHRLWSDCYTGASRKASQRTWGLSPSLEGGRHWPIWRAEKKREWVFGRHWHMKRQGNFGKLSCNLDYPDYRSK